MRRLRIAAACLAIQAFCISTAAGRSGDSIYGTVTAVRSADLVVFDYDAGTYDVRIVGITPPAAPRAAAAAREFVAGLVLRKHARIRLVGRRNQEVYAHLLTADSAVGINRDVAFELLRFGLVWRQSGFDYKYEYKYGELSAAESEARLARRGLWASAQNR